MSRSTRKKSCIACRRNKARCSLGDPCRRCEERFLECEYERVSIRQSHRQLRPNTTDQISSRLDFGVSKSPVESPSGELPPPNNAGVTTTPVGTNTGESTMRRIQQDSDNPFPLESVDWDILQSPSDSQLLFPLDPSSFFTLGLQQVTGSPSTAVSSAWRPQTQRMRSPGIPWLQPDYDQNKQTTGLDLTLPTPGTMPSAHEADRSLSDTWQITSPYRPLEPRKNEELEACFTSKVILGQLLSYPPMLVRGGRLPGYIFPSCALDGPASATECAVKGYHRCLPESLAICCTLIQSYENRTAGSALYVWKNIYAEVVRLKREYGQHHDSEAVLQALQAVSTYLLLQAGDLESIPHNDIGELLSATMVLSRRMNSLVDYESHHPQGAEVPRKDWVFIESGRRTVCLLYVIELLVHVSFRGDSRTPCTGFNVVPAPSDRYLWELVSGDEWKARRRLYVARGEYGRAPLTIGDVRRAKRAQRSGQKNEDDKVLVSRVSRWCEGLDEFGTLTWLSAVLDTAH